MKKHETTRRTFIKNASLATAALSLPGYMNLTENPSATKNILPRWKGFNLLDYFSPFPSNRDNGSKTTDDDLKWMADWGFNFVRLPMAYPRYLSFDRSKDIRVEDIYKTDPKILDEIDQLVYRTNKYGIHMSLNLHRAPGYCINAGFHEPFNLWKDKEAQDAFNFHWGMWAKRYKDISAEKLSFDLLNEPAYIEDMNDQYAKKETVPGEIYKKVAMDASNAIWAASPQRLVIADGNRVGNDVIPELFETKIAQSCRGYWPGAISHYQAPWVWKDPSKAPIPVWEGTIADTYYGRKQLEEYYKQWTDLVTKGVGVHCGECGCWKNTPHKVFLAWFEDVLDILTKGGIGYALWNFRGDFGLLDSGRKDAEYTDWHGHKLDSKLLALLKKY